MCKFNCGKNCPSCEWYEPGGYYYESDCEGYRDEGCDIGQNPENCTKYEPTYVQSLLNEIEILKAELENFKKADEKKLFENACYGKKYLCRNNTIAYYCRFSEDDNKHALMINDPENDFILCDDTGHVFSPEMYDKVITDGKYKGKTACEVYGWNRDELKEFRLDIVGELL